MSAGWLVLLFMADIIFLIFMNFNRDLVPPDSELAASEATEPGSISGHLRLRERQSPGLSLSDVSIRGHLTKYLVFY